MRKRVLLDEHLSAGLGDAFGPRDYVHLAKDVGLEGQPDDKVIDYAIAHGCLIITNDEKLVEQYRSDQRRRTKRGMGFFYGLIYLRADTEASRKRHLTAALREIAWSETRQHDDLIIVGRDGKIEHFRLCHRECAAEYDRLEGRTN